MAVIPTLAVAAACTGGEITAERLIPDYKGIETALLDGDLVQFKVSMTNALSSDDVSDYAECAAAGYTLIRGFGFARHVRTTVNMEDTLWKGDAVYTISSILPQGIKTIDAEVVAANCRAKGIPMV